MMIRESGLFFWPPYKNIKNIESTIVCYNNSWFANRWTIGLW